ncbi:anti-sigma factor family protein [Massilia sp. CMS3.1]|uniref:anti-sigma factor family protein n=1 Tax=Massilia sp. CMS3.1 TaxID=3373083 RepID=UPI003EE5D958
MKFSDELLIAFVNGELAEPARAAVERALRADPAIAARVSQLRARRSRVYGVVAGGRDGGTHAHAHGAPSGAKVVQLDMVRAARHGLLPTPAPPAPTWTPRHWSALAAALVAGTLAGGFGWHAWQGEAELASLSGADGALVAQGHLASALSAQLASPGPSGRVRIGISFLAKDGKYCRSFVMDTTAGLACHEGGAWKIPVLAQGAAGAAWMDGSGLPPAVLDAIDGHIAGAPLGPAAERAALARGWKREG